MIDIEETKATIAKQLKHLRKDVFHETQEQVIAEIDEKNLSLRAYKAYEKGTEGSLPSLEKLLHLSKHFKVPLDTLVTGRSFTDDDELTWEASLKRLSRLLFSSVLMVGKFSDQEQNETNPAGPKYYLVPIDKETEIYLDRISEFCKTKNLNFYRKNKGVYFTPYDFDSCIKDLAEDKESLEPSFKRHEHVINAYGLAPESYLEARQRALGVKKK